MTLLPLEQIRLDARSHASALRWIGLLYSQPKRFKTFKDSLGRWPLLMAFLRIYVHALPYLIILTGLGHWFLLRELGVDPRFVPDFVQGQWTEGLWLHGILPILGLAFGLGAGPISALVLNLGSGFAFGLAIGLALGSIAGLLGGFTSGFTIGLAYGLSVGPMILEPVGPLYRYRGLRSLMIRLLAVSFFLILTFGLVSGLSFRTGFDFVLSSRILYFDFRFGLASALGFVLGFLRFYYIPFNFLFVWPHMRAEIYQFHPIAWDEVCFLPFPAFDRLLVAYAEYAPEAGEREIDRLIDEYPNQRPAALRARAILVARRAAATANLARLDEVLASLPAGEKGFLRETPELRRRVHEITALQARLDTLDRPFLREPFAALLVKEIEDFERQIAGFKPPLSTEFRKAARQWLEIARRQLDAARTAATREPTHQVFRAGDPVHREREAFVLRSSILGEIERQVTLATGCPGLLVYGRRRMGKSTLLRNLEGFLPPRVQLVTLSMQEARAFTSLPDLIGLIAQRVSAIVPDGSEPPTDLKGFERFLGAAQERLDAADRRLLLAIDEYENLDRKIGEGALPEDLLAVLRESIQKHRRIIWAFAGSHSIDELDNAPWTSYLVSVRTIEVTPFEPSETRLLLTEPLKHSPLWRDDDAKRPRFEPGFWGEGGIERIHAETGGWPHLVQLVAETAVDLVNDSGGASVDNSLLERAFDRAVVRGNNVFLELVEKESRLPGEWDYLRAFRTVEEQPVPADEAVDRSLRRRRLVLEEENRYRLRVPLMARWLRQRV